MRICGTCTNIDGKAVGQLWTSIANDEAYIEANQLPSHPLSVIYSVDDDYAFHAVEYDAGEQKQPTKYSKDLILVS